MSVKIWNRKYLLNKVLEKLISSNSKEESPEAQLCQECKSRENCDVVDESCTEWEPA